MKIEKINDNQIRCTLTMDDLRSRDIRISELTYRSEKVKNLIRDTMEQAFEDFGFDCSNTPLMIEAVPISAETIVLIITKVNDPEELDSRFARFSSEKADASAPAPQLSGADDILELITRLTQTAREVAGKGKTDGRSGENGGAANDAAAGSENTAGSNVLSGAGAAGGDRAQAGDSNDASGSNAPEGRRRKGAGHDHSSDPASARDTSIAEQLRSLLANRIDQASGKKSSHSRGGDGQGSAQEDGTEASSQEALRKISRFYLFRSLDTVVRAAHQVDPAYDGPNRLFRNPDDGNYYLILRMADTAPSVFNRVCNILSEYGLQADYLDGIEQLFAEHMEIICDNQALQTLRQL